MFGLIVQAQALGLTIAKASSTKPYSPPYLDRFGVPSRFPNDIIGFLGGVFHQRVRQWPVLARSYRRWAALREVD